MGKIFGLWQDVFKIAEVRKRKKNATRISVLFKSENYQTMKKVWLESWKPSGIHKTLYKALKMPANTSLSQCFLEVLSEKNIF